MKLGISGIAGKMGKEVFHSASEKNLKVCLGIEAESLGKINIKNLFPQIDYDFPIITSPEGFKTIAKENIPDVIIDFSTKGAIIPYLDYICKNKIRTGFVIGTTGFSEEDLRKIKQYAQNVPILLSYNMSRGINLILKILPEIKKNLPDFDVEILEIHHKMKKDSPSGTALLLAEALSSEDTQKITGREGMVGPRKKNELGIFAVRGGDVVGEHIIFFLGDGERIEIKHTATSRKVFANGAIHAAMFIYEKLKQGHVGLYSSIFQ
ncbi:MAG: 4-hydroxy-tetrahydrodipicolinate reductase [Candidatus Calescibacterium sp.]|nr:4-hydroxy-tetrahydrodipicolinate reductase [Candidatus Calescibacterium sp.]MCX7734956.1 4-hydroxy-tetrahydrodipicolinate reductase [bacterium]MDW8088023.1 4-hydroxy-tetrahydrodipicolinate reductase [Candidatus Calescibacterium sp.]